jgi:UDP-N-acetylglucosamine 2-epimerase
MIEPLGYFDMVSIEENARTIITDSGGIQKEAFWLQVPCVTLRDETEWVETVESGWNKLTELNSEKILHTIEAIQSNIALNYYTKMKKYTIPLFSNSIKSFFLK